MNSWPEVSVPSGLATHDFPTLHLHDTASANKKAIAKKPLYRMYVCGITPYDATHLGHAATYLTFDLINRYLRATGAQVNFVQNITDIDDPLLRIEMESTGKIWRTSRLIFSARIWSICE